MLPAEKAIAGAGCPRGILVRCFWQKCRRLAVMSLLAEAFSAEQVTWHRVLVHWREQARLGRSRAMRSGLWGRARAVHHQQAPRTRASRVSVVLSGTAAASGPESAACTGGRDGPPLVVARPLTARPPHSPAQRHPEAGALPQPHGPQCLQPGREPDPHAPLEDASAEGEGREGGRAPSVSALAAGLGALRTVAEAASVCLGSCCTFLSWIRSVPAERRRGEGRRWVCTWGPGSAEGALPLAGARPGSPDTWSQRGRLSEKVAAGAALSRERVSFSAWRRA